MAHAVAEAVAGAVDDPAHVRSELARRKLRHWRFAAEIGVHPNKFSTLINGDGPIPPTVAAKIAAALAKEEDGHAGP